MAGMQRFVTYIYAYENEKKQQNTGFAKIEVRGNEGRLELHLRGAGIRKGEGRIAFFTEKNGMILCFPVGRLRLVNGQGDFGTVFKADSIGHSPYGFTKMEGIIITAEEGSILLSRWKEGNPIAVVPDNIRQWEPEEEKGEEAESKAEDKAKNAAENQPGKETDNNVKSIAGNAREEAENRIQERTASPSVETENHIRENGESLSGKTENLSGKTENLVQGKAENPPERAEKKAASEETSGNAMVENARKAQNSLEGVPEQPKGAPERRENVPAMTKNRGMSAKQEEQQLEREGVLNMRQQEGAGAESGDLEEDIRATEMPMRNIFPRYNWLEIWENIKETHPTFRLDGNVLCVRIELKDLREMPKKYWYLGNNSFLLHGFFNYRYLILGKLEEDRWFIGVPGIYQHQERVMAAIFGFPEFLQINRGHESGAKQSTEEPVNQFGCWYHTLEE